MHQHQCKQNQVKIDKSFRSLYFQFVHCQKWISLLFFLVGGYYRCPDLHDPDCAKKTGLSLQQLHSHYKSHRKSTKAGSKAEENHLHLIVLDNIDYWSVLTSSSIVFILWTIIKNKLYCKDNPFSSNQHQEHGWNQENIRINSETWFIFHTIHAVLWHSADFYVRALVSCIN